MSEEFDLSLSKKVVGEIYPVIKDQHGNILDGKHRKAVDPNWKETVVEVKDELEALLVRVHANIVRREISVEEKQEWVREARRILQKRGLRGTQKEIAEALGVSRQWVSKFDTREGFVRNEKVPRRSNVVKYEISEVPLNEPQIAPETTVKESNEVWSPKAPIDVDTGKIITCPECGRSFRLIHLWKVKKRDHKIEEVKE
ncbi:MAG: helix-turn-helix transcriptional regulator [Candidatus Bathyarchaeia archaeon]